jgi:hypothetical protein
MEEPGKVSSRRVMAASSFMVDARCTNGRWSHDASREGVLHVPHHSSTTRCQQT